MIDRYVTPSIKVSVWSWFLNAETELTSYLIDLNIDNATTSGSVSFSLKFNHNDAIFGILRNKLRDDDIVTVKLNGLVRFYGFIQSIGFQAFVDYNGTQQVSCSIQAISWATKIQQTNIFFGFFKNPKTKEQGIRERKSIDPIEFIVPTPAVQYINDTSEYEHVYYEKYQKLLYTVYVVNKKVIETTSEGKFKSFNSVVEDDHSGTGAVLPFFHYALTGLENEHGQDVVIDGKAVRTAYDGSDPGFPIAPYFQALSSVLDQYQDTIIVLLLVSSEKEWKERRQSFLNNLVVLVKYLKEHNILDKDVDFIDPFGEETMHFNNVPNLTFLKHSFTNGIMPATLLNSLSNEAMFALNVIQDLAGVVSEFIDGAGIDPAAPPATDSSNIPVGECFIGGWSSGTCPIRVNALPYHFFKKESLCKFKAWNYFHNAIETASALSVFQAGINPKYTKEAVYAAPAALPKVELPFIIDIPERIKLLKSVMSAFKFKPAEAIKKVLKQFLKGGYPVPNNKGFLIDSIDWSLWGGSEKDRVLGSAWKLRNQNLTGSLTIGSFLNAAAPSTWVETVYSYSDDAKHPLRWILRPLPAMMDANSEEDLIAIKDYVSIQCSRNFSERGTFYAINTYVPGFNNLSMAMQDIKRPIIRTKDLAVHGLLRKEPSDPYLPADKDIKKIAEDRTVDYYHRMGLIHESLNLSVTGEGAKDNILKLRPGDFVIVPLPFNIETTKNEALDKNAKADYINNWFIGELVSSTIDFVVDPQSGNITCNWSLSIRYAQDIDYDNKLKVDSWIKR